MKLRANLDLNANESEARSPLTRMTDQEFFDLRGSKLYTNSFEFHERGNISPNVISRKRSLRKRGKNLVTLLTNYVAHIHNLECLIQLPYQQQ